MTRTLKPLILNTGALALTLILIYTGISAHDKLTWLMEVTPVIIVVPLLLATAKRYPLTPLLYTLIFFHAIILMVGGQYTYAKVPIGFEVQEWLGLSRNPYDKLGHFFQDGIVICLPVGFQAARAVLDAVFRVGKAAAAPVAQGIQRAIAKQAAEAFRICALVARKILTFFILKKIVICHIPISFGVWYNLNMR